MADDLLVTEETLNDPLILRRLLSDIIERLDNDVNSVSSAALSEQLEALEGGITSYYQTEPPPISTDLIIGDLWFDTDDYNRAYRFNGFEWVLVQDGTIALAQTDAANALVGLATQAQLADGLINYFFQDDPPSGQGEAEGDLWLDTNDNDRVYRYLSGAWSEITDPGEAAVVQDSLLVIYDIAGAQATADSKIVTFVSPTEPIGGELGDLWMDSDDGNRLYRFNGTAWVDIRDTDIDYAISQASIALGDALTAQLAADNAQATADGKITTFYQTTMPTVGEEGDIWIDTDDGDRAYYHNGVTFIDIQDADIAQSLSDAAQAIADASTAQATADGKITTFYQDTAPVAEGEGDFWVDTDDGNKLYRWSGSVWVDVHDAAIDNLLYQAEMFNFYSGFESHDYDNWTADTGHTKTLETTDVFSGTQAVKITTTTVDTDASGTVGGLWTTINESLALYLAGRKIRVAAYVKTADACSQFQMAYSTAEVGNSGWITFTPTASWARYEFEYTVALPVVGQADYIGIQGHTSGTILVDNVAVTLADGTVFYQDAEPTVGMVENDLWFDTNDGNKLYYYDSVAWVNIQDNAIALAQLDATQALSDSALAQATADGKITTYYQTTAPASPDTGDLWMDSDDGNKLYRYDGAWSEVQDDDIILAITDAATAQATADGKIETYYQTTAPSSPTTGDLWIDTDNGDLLYRYSGSAWIYVENTAVTNGNNLLADPNFVERANGRSSAWGTNAQMVYSATSGENSTAGATITANSTVIDVYYGTDIYFPFNITDELYIYARIFVSTTFNGTVALGTTAYDKDKAGLSHWPSIQTSTPTKGSWYLFGGKVTGLTNGSTEYLRFRLSVRNDATLGTVTFSSVYFSKEEITAELDSDITAAAADATQAIADAYAAQVTADGKIETFYQAAQPGTASIGDLWIETDNNNKLWRYNGTSWEDAKDDEIAVALADAATAISDASAAQATADGKITTYYAVSAPTGVDLGDLWFDTDDNNKLYRYSGTAWVVVQDGDIADAALTATWGSVTGTGKPDDNADVTGNNQAGSVAPEDVLTGTMDDVTIATSLTGQRIVISASGDELQFYDVNNDLISSIGINSGIGTDSVILKVGADSAAAGGIYTSMDIRTATALYNAHFKSSNNTAGAIGLYTTAERYGLIAHTGGSSSDSIALEVRAGTSAFPFRIKPSTSNTKPFLLAGAHGGCFWIPDNEAAAAICLDDRWRSGFSRYELISEWVPTAVAGRSWTWTAAYDTIIVLISGIVPATDGADLYCQLSVNGVGFKTGASDYETFTVVDSAGAVASNPHSDSNIPLSADIAGVGSNNSEGLSGRLELVGANSIRSYPLLDGSITYTKNNGVGEIWKFVARGNDGAFDGAVTNGLQIVWDSGNFEAQGRIALYGIAAS